MKTICAVVLSLCVGVFLGRHSVQTRVLENTKPQTADTPYLIYEEEGGPYLIYQNTKGGLNVTSGDHYACLATVDQLRLFIKELPRLDAQREELATAQLILSLQSTNKLPQKHEERENAKTKQIIREANGFDDKNNKKFAGVSVGIFTAFVMAVVGIYYGVRRYRSTRATPVTSQAENAESGKKKVETPVTSPVSRPRSVASEYDIEIDDLVDEAMGRAAEKRESDTSNVRREGKAEAEASGQRAEGKTRIIEDQKQ